MIDPFTISQHEEVLLSELWAVGTEKMVCPEEVHKMLRAKRNKSVCSRRFDLRKNLVECGLRGSEVPLPLSHIKHFESLDPNDDRRKVLELPRECFYRHRAVVEVGESRNACPIVYAENNGKSVSKSVQLNAEMTLITWPNRIRTVENLYAMFGRKVFDLFRLQSEEF